jgi:hypothetical protein
MRIALGLLFIIPACHALSAPDEVRSPQLVVPGVEHAVRLEGGFYSAEIPFRYTNRTGDTLVITGCHPPGVPRLEWWNGEAWRMAFQYIELMCLSAPFVIAPGTIIDDTVRLSVFRDSVGPSGHLTLPHWEASRSVGEYRLMWPLQNQAPPARRREYLGGTPRPLADRISNTFRLRIATP